MLKFSWLITSLIFLYACSSESQSPKQQTLVKRDATITKTIKEEKVYDLITDKNVVEKLTEYGKLNPETIIDIYTSKGKIKVKLYEDTPLHRANFILLAKSGYLTHCLFSRVSKKFMAQFGGSYDDLQREIQDTIGKYTIPSEMSHHHFHKKGALGAARSYNNNPDKRSECDEFYFVEGTKYSFLALDGYEEEHNYKYNDVQQKYYKTNSGAAHIDGEHTVFGEIIEGFNVVPKLTHVDTDSQDWPVVDIYVDSVVVK